MRDESGLCILPWVSVQINQDGAALPCCRTDEKYLYGDLSGQDLVEILDSDERRALRAAMMRGEKPNVCSGCYAVEAAGGFSHRQDMNAKFQDAMERIDRTTLDGQVEDESLLHLGLRFSNVCNLRCRTCTPRNSTAWRADAKALGEWLPNSVKITPRPTTREYLDQLRPHLGTVRELYFAGGEPLLDEGHYELLEGLLAAGRADVRLVYNTNLSTLELGKWKALELWSRFETISINASFDGVGAHAELLRKGCDWQATVLNYIRVRMLKNVEFSVHCTVSVLNCFHLPTAIDEWITRGMISNTNTLFFNLVREPDYYSIDVLNDEERAHLRSTYEAYWEDLMTRVDFALFEDIRERMEVVLNSFGDASNPEVRARFNEKTRKLDVIRSESFASLTPQISY